MVIISENVKAIGIKLYEILCKQSLAQMEGRGRGRTQTHISVTGNSSKSRCPPRQQGQGRHNLAQSQIQFYRHQQPMVLDHGTVPNMKKIQPTILEECRRTDEQTDGLMD